MQSRIQRAKEYEDIALLAAGLLVIPGSLVFHSLVGEYAMAALMVGWLVWFSKWAVTGGMPRGL